jgi:hypothetical protein
MKETVLPTMVALAAMNQLERALVKLEHGIAGRERTHLETHTRNQQWPRVMSTLSSEGMKRRISNSII